MRAIVRRLMGMLFTLWLAATLAFVALRLLPGNAIDAQLSGSGQPPEVIAARKAAYGLDAPIYVQYVAYLAGILRGDFGQSLYGGQTVVEILAQRLPPTITLASLSMLVALALGLALGILGGLPVRYVSWLARLLVDFALGFPVYWTGLLVMLVFAGYLGGVRNNIVLPVFVLGFHSAGAIARTLQVNVSEAYYAPFVRTARAKGLPQHQIVLRHVLRFSLIPIVTIIALQSGILFSGTVITETIFLRPGIGQLLLDATLQHNYPVVQGIVIVVAAGYIVVNTLADVITWLLDPRIARP